jgi:hypothetical protein
MIIKHMCVCVVIAIKTCVYCLVKRCGSKDNKMCNKATRSNLILLSKKRERRRRNGKKSVSCRLHFSLDTQTLNSGILETPPRARDKKRCAQIERASERNRAHDAAAAARRLIGKERAGRRKESSSSSLWARANNGRPADRLEEKRAVGQVGNKMQKCLLTRILAPFPPK